jgi:2-dehydropantoate 2-reductase
MLEVVAIAAALGYEIPLNFAEHQIERTRPMGAYKASTLVDFERGQPIELESLFLKPRNESRRLGVAAPRLEALCRVLNVLNPHVA